MIRVRAGRGLFRPDPARWAREAAVVPPHAVPEAAGGLQPEAPQRVGRHRPRPVRSGSDRRGYDEYIDQLVYAEECGFDGICINEHHANGYGLMPSPNLFALGPRHHARRGRRITVLGNSVALYNPPVRVAEEMAVIDLMSRGRLIAGFPVGTSMDTAYAYSVNPGTLRAKYAKASTSSLQAWTEPEPFAFNGRFTQMRYVNVMPAAAAAAAPADLDPRRRLGRDVGLLRAERLRLRRAVVLRPPHGAGERRGLLAPRRGERQGPEPVPARLRAVHRRGRHRRRGLQALQGAGRVLLQPVAARVRRLRRPARLRDRGVGAGAVQVAGAPDRTHEAGRSTTSRGTRWSRRATSSSAAPTPCARRSRRWRRPSTAGTCSPCCTSAT